MKVYIASLLKWDSATGVQTHVREVFPFLKASKLEPYFVCPHEGSRLERIFLGLLLLVRIAFYRILPANDVEIYRHGHGLVLKRRLQRELAREGSCTIYAQCPVSAQSALAARVGVHQKVILVIHFNISQADEFVGQGRIKAGARTYRAIRAFEAALLPRVDGLIFVSEFMRREILQRIPMALSVPYRVLPNFLTYPVRKLDSGTKDFDLVCIGTLEARKNQRYALEIVAAARQIGRSLSLTLIGDGPDRFRLEALAREMNIESSVRFLGFVAQAADYLVQHKALLHVAKMESFGIVLIEALSRGVPVFAPAVGGIPEVFSDGVEGRLIPMDDPTGAVELILDWLDAPGAMESAGLAARQRFDSRFRGDIVGPQLALFLQEQA